MELRCSSGASFIASNNVTNQQARTKAASLIRAFLLGKVDNFVLMEDFPRDQNDRALNAIERRLWFHYDDVKRRHCGFLLDSPEEVLFRRCALFLDTTLEYEWPDLRGHNLAHPIIAILTGDIFRFRRVQHGKEAGEYAVWPFFRRSDMADAKGAYGQNEVKADDGPWLPTGTSGKIWVAYMALQTLFLLGGLSALIACLCIRSETLLLAGIAGVILYLLLFALDRFVRPQSSHSSVRSA